LNCDRFLSEVEVVASATNAAVAYLNFARFKIFRFPVADAKNVLARYDLGETKVLPGDKLAAALVGDPDTFRIDFKLRPPLAGGSEEMFPEFLDQHNHNEQSCPSREMVEDGRSDIRVGGHRVGGFRPEHCQRNGCHQGSLQGDPRQKEGLVVTRRAERVKGEDSPQEAGGERVISEAIATHEEAGRQESHRRCFEAGRLLG
jgi:hypothetical protein